MAEPRKSRILPRVLIAGVLVLGCSALALIGLIVAQQWRYPAGNPALSSQFVGTWVGERGNVLQFRSDGTARSRSSASEQADYFEWRTTQTELEVFFGPPENRLGWTINRYVLGNPSDRYEVQKITPDQFQLLDAKSGKSLQFKRIDDSRLDSAP